MCAVLDSPRLRLVGCTRVYEPEDKRPDRVRRGTVDVNIDMRRRGRAYGRDQAQDGANADGPKP
jgi:hypothetical protein